MAGGKETPRQKMIGMMYMVLTALLALNVSSAVLEKFAIIDETLREMIEVNKNSNENTLKAIEGAPVKGAAEDAAKAKAKEIRELTKGILTYMDDVKTKMAKEKDGSDIPKEQLAQNTNRAEELMLDESKGKGTSLALEYEKKLDGYVEELNKLIKQLPDEVNGKKIEKKQFEDLTKTAGQYEIFKEAKEELKKQPYEAFAFHGTPTMGAIAYVSQMQTEVLEYEKEALATVNQIVRGEIVEVDQVVAMVRAQANTLVAGQTYEGDLFVAGAASGIDPVMYKGSESVKVEEVEIAPGIKIKMGKIKFKAGATNYDPKTGIAKMSFPVKIEIPGKTLNQTVEYSVVRPKAVFSSVASSTLYMECGNIKDVSIQGLTEVSGLELSCSPDQGKIMKLGSGKFALIPKRPQMDVSIKMDGVNIGVEKFFAKAVPEPQGILKVNGAEVKKEEGAPLGVAKYELRIPDDTFVSENRADAGYRITKMVVFTPSGPKTLNNNTIDMNALGLRKGQTFTIGQVVVVRSTYDPNEPDDKVVNCKLGDTFIVK